MKIIFFGTSEFAVPALEALHGTGFDITVITMPDQPVGRKKVLTPPPVKVAAEKLGLRVLQPTTLKAKPRSDANASTTGDDAFFEEFQSLKPDFCVIAAYGKIIAERYINIPKYGFLNIHPSLLPKYRGPTPVQAAILNGDTETGVTIMQIDKDMDHGPLLASQEFSIFNFQFSNAKELENKLAEIGAKLLVEIIPKLISGEIKPKEQDHSQATYCKIFSREDARIDWSRSPREIYNQIRALNPEPGTWTTWQDKILNIREARIKKYESREELEIIKLQLEGKKETSLSEFLHGHPDFDISQLK